MKNKLFFLALIAMVLVGCSKDDGEENGGSLPQLPDPNDVCSAMDDSESIRYCYDHFDLDKDLAVSPKEAALVRKIDCDDRDDDFKLYDVRSVKGIEYFPNLVELNFGGWNSAADLDLSYNLGLTKFGDYAFPYGIITLKLPKTLEEVDSGTFASCYDLTTIYCPAVEPPHVDSGELYVRDVLSKIYVPKASAAKYQKAEGWKTCASKIVGYDF